MEITPCVMERGGITYFALGMRAPQRFSSTFSLAEEENEAQVK